MVDEIKVDIVADDQLSDALNNVAKQIAKFSRTTNTALENINDSLLAVADAARGVGGGIAEGARRGTQELKKLEAQAQKTQQNISSTGPSRPLSDAAIGRVQAAMAESPRQGQEQMNIEVQRELDLRRQIEDQKQQEARQAQELVKQQKLQAQEAEKLAKLSAAQERAEAERINKIAIANVLFARQEKLLDANADQAQIMERAISRVTPAVQQAVNTLPRLRYALFDVSRGAALLSAGLAAVALAPAGIAINYRRQFADVERTTGVAGEQAEQLRQDFIKLKQDIPISWEEITDIGTLAGQLGISSSLIADFTASVARFAATTDLNVEQTATLFGRLNELIDGVDGQFEKLSSAISRVGVISVATESQIGAVSQQIASIANVSNFAADEIIGLAGSLASLGIAPELARGTITRLFTNINSAVSLGGRNLEEYGRITNRTAEDFAQAWSDAPAQALLDFFAGIDREGVRAERTLRELGITSVRDVPAILRLAQNQSLVTELIAESSKAYEEGTESQRQYSIITATVSERLRLLGQNFELLVATIGDSANALGPFVDAANSAVRTLINLTNNDVAKWAFFAAGAATLFVAAIALLVAALARAGAGASGLVTALIDTQRALLGTSASAKIAEVGLLGFVRATLSAATATRTFGNVLRGIIIFAAISAVFTAIGAAINAYEKATRSASDAAKDAFGEISSFTEAVKTDTAAYRQGADAIFVRTRAVEDDADAITSARDATLAWVQAQEEAEDVTNSLTDAVRQQETAFGENALQAGIDLALSGDSDISGFVTTLASDPGVQAALDSLGFQFEEVIRQSFSGNAAQYVNEFITAINSSLAANQGRLSELENIAFSGQQLTPEQIAEYQQLTAIVTEQTRVSVLLRQNLVPIAQGYDNISAAAEQTGAEIDFVTGGFDDQAGAAAFTNERIDELIDTFFGAANAAARTEDALANLGGAFSQSGEDALFASEEIQAVIQAILFQSGDASVAVEQLGAFMAYLASIGVDVTGPALEYVRGIIAVLGAEANLTDAEIQQLANGLGSLSDFIDFGAAFERGAEQVRRGAGGAAREVKSFADQMKELLDDVFEFANNSQSASNAIFDLGAAFAEIGDEAFYAGSEMQSAIKSIVGASRNGEEAVANLSALLATLSGQSGVSSASLQVLRQVIQEVGANAGLSAARIQQLVASAGAGLSTVALGNFSRGLDSVNRQVRTLVDYASDLSQVFTRAFDIRFKAVLNMDGIRETWQELNDEIDETTRTLASLSADQNVKRYFLSIAEAYGDTLRADVIRAELAEIETEIRDAQAALSREVVGDSQAARQNRRTITDLVSQYQEYIVSLAESGASQEELRQAVDRARSDFEEQARLLGFSEQVIQQYAVAFDDVRTAIDKVPRNITVEANVNPALQALNELNAALERNIEAARVLNTTLGQPVPPKKIDPQVVVRPVVVGGVTLVGTPSDAEKAFRQAQANIGKRKFYSGGFTGRGGTYDPAGIVHRGEYVIPKQYVNQSTGMPDPNFLAQLQNGMRSFANGGFVGGGGMAPGDAVMVELSPYDRKLLENAGNVQLRLNGKVVAEATNQNNFNQARRGSD